MSVCMVNVRSWFSGMLYDVCMIERRVAFQSDLLVLLLVLTYRKLLIIVGDDETV